MAETPGAVVHARVFSNDDPDRLGWDRLRQVMADEGKVTMRGVNARTLEVAKKELAAFSPVLHFWDLFMADADALRRVCGPIASQGLPEGIRLLPTKALTAQKVREVQAFLDTQGVSPFSADALLGRLFPAKLVVLEQRGGAIAAAGFAAMTHNRFSRFENAAWVGLIAVAPELRGTGLGKTIDAMCNLAAVDALGADSTMEFVAPDNAPSRAMLESCGLRQVPDRMVVMLSTSADRLTR